MGDCYNAFCPEPDGNITRFSVSGAIIFDSNRRSFKYLFSVCEIKTMLSKVGAAFSFVPLERIDIL